MRNMMVFGKLFVILFLVVWVALISLPGIGITYVGWKISRNMKPLVAQAAFRAGLIAITITPSVWGHGMILPALVLALVLQGRERLVGVVPILVVWAVMIPALGVRTIRQRQ